MKKFLRIVLCAVMLINMASVVLAEAINMADGCKTEVTIKKAYSENVAKDGIIGKDEYTEVLVNRDPETTDLLYSWNDGVNGSSLLDSCMEFVKDVHFYFSWDEENGLNMAVRAKLLETPWCETPQPAEDAMNDGAGNYFPGDEFCFQFGAIFKVAEQVGKKENLIIYRGLGYNTAEDKPLTGHYGKHGYTGSYDLVEGENYAVAVDGNWVTYEISYPLASVLKSESINGSSPVEGASILLDVTTTGGSTGSSVGDSQTYAVSLGDYGYMYSKWAGTNLQHAKGTFSNETFGTVDTEPEETDPIVTDPIETDPIETDPIETDPIETDPIETDPIETDPIETDPIETDPIETDPIESKPDENEPTTFTFDTSSGHLVVSGKGEMGNIYLGNYLEEVKTVTIEEGLTSISSRAFSNCLNLESISIPDSVTTIGDYAFMTCQKLSKIELPDSIETIEENAFLGCVKLKDIVIPNGITEISPETFCGCIKLESIVIPAGVTHIGKNAFAYNNSLTTVNFEGTKEQWENIVIESGNEDLLNAKILFGKQIFDDVALDAWYAEYTAYAYENGLMKGTSDTTFAPEAKMDRSMVVTVLWRIAGEPVPTSASPFTDLKEDWYMDPVAWAYENDIVKGTGGTTFGPTDSVTREQLATFLYRFSSYMGYDMSASAELTSFPDSGNVSDWATDALKWAVAEGLITGSNEGGVLYLNPNGTATRAQVATILTRFHKKY